MPRHRKRTEPWYDRRDNGVYYAYRYNPEKKRVERESLGTEEPREAALRFADFLVRGPRSARYVTSLGVSVESVLDQYEIGHVQPNVVDKPRQHDAIRHLKTFFRDMPVRDVDVTQSRAYAEARRRGDVGGGKRRRDVFDMATGDVIDKSHLRKASNTTIRRELNVLVAAANHCRRMRTLPGDQMPDVELPTDTRATEVPWLTKDEMRRLLAAADGHLRDFILLAYYTAARRRSIERLTKAQVDLRQGRLNLQPINAPRTKKRRPVVPIFPEIRPTIERLMDASTTEYLLDVRRDMYRPFTQLCERLGLKAHPHVLRHSRATHMLLDGEDPYKVAKLLGDTMQTVERVYGHYSTDYLKTKSSLEVA